MNMHALSTSPHRRSGSHSWVRLAVFAAGVTVGAATLAWLLAAVAHLAETTVVGAVATVAFAISWVVTNHRPARTHRVTIVRSRIGAH